MMELYEQYSAIVRVRPAHTHLSFALSSFVVASMSVAWFASLCIMAGGRVKGGEQGCWPVLFSAQGSE